MQPLDDRSLLRQYAETWSDEAYTELVTRHINFVYSVAVRQVGDSHQAEEIAQAVFIILAKKAASLRHEKALTSWLFQTTRLTANNFIRGEMRRHRREQEAFMQSPENESPDAVWRQIGPELDAAVAGLGTQDQHAILLRFYEGRTLREIGAVLGASEDAAEKRVTRALEKLRQFFRRRGVDSTTAALAGAISANSVQAAPIGLAKTISAVAVAKGAAASTSTLTLVKGALKVMAWTKTKITITAAAVALLAVGGSVVTITAFNAARTTAGLARMQGNWEGTLNAGPAKLRLVLKIFETNGVYVATLDSIDQGAKDIPIPKVSATPHSIHVEMPALGVDYQATLNSDGTALTGRFKQLQLSTLFTLKRTDTPDTVASLSPEQYTPQANSPLQGAWEGIIKIGKTSMRLDLRIAETAPGTFKAEMDSPDQGAMNLPVTSMSYNAPAVEFKMDAIGGSYHGTLNDSGDEFAGTWTQMRRKFPLKFDRVTTNATASTEAEKDYGQGGIFEIQGHWKGSIRTGGIDLHIVLHIAKMPDGTYSATMDSPDQGAIGIPATSVDWTSPNVRLEWKQFGGVYSGKLENGKLSGKWQQGKAGIALELQRAS